MIVLSTVGVTSILIVLPSVLVASVALVVLSVVWVTFTSPLHINGVIEPTSR